MMEWCEECKDYKRDAYRRPDAGGRVLCNHHYYEFLRRNSPTQTVRIPAHLRVGAIK
jgi:hypothetical protein